MVPKSLKRWARIKITFTVSMAMIPAAATSESVRVDFPWSTASSTRTLL